MKLVQILYSGLGGHGSVAFSLAEATEDRWRHEMVFVGIEPVLAAYARRCGIRGYGQAHVAVTEGRPWTAWPALYRVLARIRPDAILLHSVKTILPCALYAARHGVRLVAVEHQPNRLKSRSEWIVSHLAMRLAHAVVLLTPEYGEELRRRLGQAWAAEKVVLIPNGISTALFRPGPRPEPPPPIRVGMAARLSSRKRQALLVEAMAILAAEDGPEAWHLSLAGDGTEAPRLRARIAALGLDGMIDLLGALDEAALRAWFASLDVYAHASDGETLSTSLLQALACGLPVLGSGVPGIAEMLARGGGVGLVAEAETPSAFAAGLRRLAQDPALRDALGRKARALATTEFDQAVMADRYAGLLAR